MSEIKSRKEIDSRYNWKLEDIFANDEAWETAFSDVRARAKSFEDYKGRTTENAKTLLEVLTMLDEIGEDLLSVSVYASMRRDEDNLVSKYRALVERAGELESDVAGAVSFVEPEIAACGKDRVLRYMDEEAGLKVYAHFFDNLFREAEHILTPYGEKLLALSGPVGDAAHDIFSAMNNADLQFDPVTDKDLQNQKNSNKKN